jgi:hypothetical protein
MLLSYTPEDPVQQISIPYHMESLPPDAYQVEVIVTDLFSGEERLRFNVDP